MLRAAFSLALVLGCSVLALQLGFPSHEALVPSFYLSIPTPEEVSFRSLRVTVAVVGLFAVAAVVLGVAGVRTRAPSAAFFWDRYLLRSYRCRDVESAGIGVHLRPVATVASLAGSLIWQVANTYPMVTVDRVWNRLAERNGMIFLIAGGMYFLATANDALGAYTPLTTQAGIPLAIEAVAGFGGMVLAIVGLVGLYPRLADRCSRLARLGVGLVALPAGVFAILITCAIPAGVLGIPSPASVIPALDTIVIAGLLMTAVGAMFFGTAALREPTLAPHLGASLLVLGVAWFLLFGAASLNGFPIAHRVILGTGMLQTPALFGAGYALHLDPETTTRTHAPIDHSVEE